MVSPQTMNSVLRTLEQDGHIERRPHPDSKRADSWSLTDSGLSALESARGLGATVFTRMLGPLRSDEVAAFIDYLHRCIAALEQANEPADDSADGRPQSQVVQRRQKAGVSSTRNV
jgi:DNA-binding MarR family transcriptional regulator